MKARIKTTAILLIATVLFSCKKADVPLTQKPADINLQVAEVRLNETVLGKSGDPQNFNTSVTLVAGQHINAGNIEVTNDDEYIYVTYATANGYTLTQTHLYVGNCALIPVTRAGNPIPGQFPNATAHRNITSYMYRVPISAITIGNCGCIAAHAVVQKLDAKGKVIDEQTAWGQGTRINPTGGNWGMKFEYCSIVYGT